MHLIISRTSFRLEGVPRVLHVSDLPFRVSYRCGNRVLRGPLQDAGLLVAELARRGVHVTEDLVRAAAARAVQEDVIGGPAHLVKYGDPRAIPELSGALDAYRPSRDCEFPDYLAVLGLGTAIQFLGGAPTTKQLQKIARYERRQRALWEDGGAFMRAQLAEITPLALTASPRRGVAADRSDTCHCGSGENYADCHLETDRATQIRH